MQRGRRRRAPLHFGHLKQIVIYAALGGILIAGLKLLEYHYFVRTLPGALYGGILAVVFTVLGGWLGTRWNARRVAAPIAPVSPAARDSFAAGESARKDLGITPREHEILGLIAEGLSNREIGERLFVSENTVKTHSSRLFQKLGVVRRVQAVQKARELRLIP